MRVLAAAGSRVHLVLCQGQVDREHDQALLGAVVEVALDAAQLGCLELDGRGTAAPEALVVPPERVRRADAQQTLDDVAMQDRHPAGGGGGDGQEHQADDERDADGCLRRDADPGEELVDAGDWR